MPFPKEKRILNALALTREAAMYKHTHGRYPSQKAATKKAAKVGVWLSNRRGALNGSGTGVWYPECEELAIKLGCPDMFTFIRAEEFIPEFKGRIAQLAEYKRKHGNYPPASNPQKKTYSKKALRLGRWLTGMRGAKENIPNRTNTYIWFPEFEEHAIACGEPDMFERPIYEAGNIKFCLTRTRRIAEYKKKYGKYPTSHSDNGQPLAGWLYGMRRAKAGEAGKDDHFVWFDECAELAAKLGCADMYKQRRRIRCLKARTKAIIRYNELYGKYPSMTDRNEGTRQLGFWLRQMRQVKDGKRPGYSWHPECEQVACDMGDPTLFEKRVA